MAIENVVISYKADVSDVKRQVKQLERLNKTLGKNLGKDFTNGATVVSRELTKITSLAKGIKLPLGGITNQTKQFTTVLRGVNGELTTVRQTVAGTGKNIKVLNQTVRSGANVTRTMGQNLATLAKRAALTIPLWFALRRGVQAVFSTIREGLKAIVDFDQALQKARRNLQGTAADIERNFGILKNEVTKLSLETGRGVEDITNAFQKFATVGFDFETSLAGANNATKLSILLFGDAEQTATAFARSMRVLVDESRDAKPAGEQLAEVMALTSELWKTNAFELNELTQSLEKFAPVAKTAGFSAQETVKVLAALSTAGIRGGRAGRLLRTSLVRLVTSTDKLASSLGVKVNPEVDRTFDVFLRTLDVLAKTRKETGKVAPQFEKVVKSIFGLRSSDAIKGLVALRKNLQNVLEVTGDVGNFNKEFAEVNKTVFQLVAQFKNFNKEIGKAFVTGLVGGEDFRDSLEEIVKIQANIIKNARAIGKALTLSGQITFGVTSGASETIIEEVNQQLLDRIIGTKQAKEALKKQQDEILQNNDKLLKGLEGGLKKIDLERLVVEIETDIKLDTGQFTIDKSVLTKAKKALQERLDDLEDLEPDIKIKLGTVEIVEEQQNKLIKALIKDQLERLKLQGATESQLLKIEDRLIKQTDINDDIIAQKIRQLEIDRKITEEQKARTQFSSESAKLGEIAKTEGIATAKAISEVLNGQRDFNIFLKQGGDRAEILKDQFADFVKNQELLKLFTGKGSGIIIKENVGQRDFTPIRAQSQFTLAKARIGLQESTNKNNLVVQQNTLSLQELTKKFLGFGTVTGTQILQAKNQPIVSGTKALTGTQNINLNIDISGKTLRLSGSPDEIRDIAKNLAPAITPIIERALAFKLKSDNNAPISKATDERIIKK